MRIQSAVTRDPEGVDATQKTGSSTSMHVEKLLHAGSMMVSCRRPQEKLAERGLATGDVRARFGVYKGSLSFRSHISLYHRDPCSQRHLIRRPPPLSPHSHKGVQTSIFYSLRLASETYYVEFRSIAFFFSSTCCPTSHRLHHPPAGPHSHHTPLCLYSYYPHRLLPLRHEQHRT